MAARVGIALAARRPMKFALALYAALIALVVS